MKRSESPSRRDFAPDPTVPTTGAYSAPQTPAAGGQRNIPSPRTPPVSDLRASPFGPRHFRQPHSVVDGIGAYADVVTKFEFAVNQTAVNGVVRENGPVKTKFHYALLVADRSETGRRPAASWNLAYHLAG